MSMQGAMEQTRYWMWTRRKLMTSGRPSWFPSIPPTSSFPSSAAFSSYNDSWEEQAFAEDAVGGLQGEYVWPPRSYSCSFCRREFRSAQALGGHMNVHRRDRARLKSSPPPQLEIAHDDGRNDLLHHHRQHLSYQPTQVCSVVSGSNPNHEVVASPPPVASTKENCSDKKAFASPFFIAREQQRKRHVEALSDLKLGRDDLKPREGDHGEESEGSGEEEEEEITNCSNKRQRTDGSLPFLIPTAGGRDHRRFGEHGHCHEPIHEELDLELRLGDRPKIK